MNHPWVHFTDEPGIVSIEVSSKDNPRRVVVYEGGKPNRAEPKLPKPSKTPPMWANDPTRSRRPKRRKNQPTRQGIA